VTVLNRPLNEMKLKQPEHFVFVETKQFQNFLKTVSKLFCFSFISLCGQFF